MWFSFPHINFAVLQVLNVKNPQSYIITHQHQKRASGSFIIIMIAVDQINWWLHHTSHLVILDCSSALIHLHRTLSWWPFRNVTSQKCYQMSFVNLWWCLRMFIGVLMCSNMLAQPGSNALRHTTCHSLAAEPTDDEGGVLQTDVFQLKILNQIPAMSSPFSSAVSWMLRVGVITYRK